MPAFSTQRRVAHTAAEMYALVADVERYPEFLPMCTGLVVYSRAPSLDGEDLTARMSVGYKSISESFMTRVALRPATREIDASYLDGPFKRLENSWRFKDQQGGGSIVDFHIDYEFKSPMLGVLVASVFDQAFRKFTDAFETRARAVYGARPALA
jgi:coenzyme Q-binding protein COQ10